MFLTRSSLPRLCPASFPVSVRSPSSTRRLSHFKLVEHTLPCSYVRQHLGGAEPGHHGTLKLRVKQYIPKDSAQNGGHPAEGLTIIGAHGNGLPRELLEPYWDDLYERLTSINQTIRSIWVADNAYQGQSGVLNEKVLGDDPSWFDHARDLLHMINLMQEAMPPPIFGVGHSMGAAQLANLALLHPALLQGLVLMDPVLQTHNPGVTYGLASTYRRDVWPSREEARERFAKNKFYQSWDGRVFDKWIQHGLRDLPTELYPDKDAVEGTSPVTLTTPKHNEVHFYLRPLYKGAGVAPTADLEHYSDFRPEDGDKDIPFYRPEPAILFRRLGELKPAVKYVHGRNSPLAPPDVRQRWLSDTGSGVGGSGGHAHGRVFTSELDCGHFVPMERPSEAATETAEFLDREARRWTDQHQSFIARWYNRPRPQRVQLDAEWLEKIGPPR